MGGIFGRIWAQLFGYTEMRILMLGMDSAGKSSILYRLKFGEEIKTIPTLEFNVETLYCRHLQLTVWDIGGGEQQRKIWRFYAHGTNGLVFVVDSCDHERIHLVKEEVHKMLNTRELSSCPVLVFANKQDLENAMDVREITTQLDLEQLGLRRWWVQPSVATSGQGLREGFDWLARVLAEVHRRKAVGLQPAEAAAFGNHQGA